MRPDMGNSNSVNSGRPKKTPARWLGVKPLLLSHIKAPLREEKRGAVNHPTAI